MKTFNILDSLTKEKIIEKMNKLGEARLTPTSHLHHKYGEEKIIDAARKYSKEYSDSAGARPAVRLIEVVLAANRNYVKAVKPHVDRIEKTTDLKTFDQLIDLVEKSKKEDFFYFWGHKDEKKYNVLKSILIKIETLRKKYPDSKDDFELMKNWAENVDLKNYENDIIGQIRNVALATIQHLRMTFGHDTVKPDQRVKEVLELEFNQPKLNNVNTVLAVEQIAKLSDLRTLEIDQVFVNYGAGYYNRLEGGFEETASS